MEHLKSITNCLVSLVETQLGDTKHTNAKELGEVIDMIKDLEEAMYYCSIIEAMDKSEEEKMVRSSHYYVPYMEYAPYMMRDEKWRDERFGNIGRSGLSRHMYMENKQYSGRDEDAMMDLEHYIRDLGEDITDMVKTSSPEEKQLLSSKLQQLATKINK